MRAKLWTIGVAMISISAMVTTANAEFQRWTHVKEADPFTGGQKVTVTYMDTLRSGVFMSCDTSEAGIKIRAVPGFDYDPLLNGLDVQVSFAIDGQLLLTVKGSPTSVGNNLAASDAHLNPKEAATFLSKFSAAKKQIAIKDGIAEQPHLLSARGSTDAGGAIQLCLNAQKSHTETSDADDQIVQLKQSQLMEIYKIARTGVVDAYNKNGIIGIEAEKAGAGVVADMLKVVD